MRSFDLRHKFDTSYLQGIIAEEDKNLIPHTKKSLDNPTITRLFFIYTWSFFAAFPRLLR